MNITVMMASGDEDTWEGVADAIDDAGSLIIVSEIEGDEVSGEVKTLTVRHEVEQEGAPPMVKGHTFRVEARYAPGMWMKVEFE